MQCCATYGDRAFDVAGPRLWNNLPASLRSTDSFAQFRKQLKTYLFGDWGCGGLVTLVFRRRTQIFLLTYLPASKVIKRHTEWDFTSAFRHWPNKHLFSPARVFHRRVNAPLQENCSDRPTGRLCNAVIFTLTVIKIKSKIIDFS